MNYVMNLRLNLLDQRDEYTLFQFEDDDEKTTKIMNFEKERLDVIKVEHN
jgi:hypothetical protein